MNQSYQAIENRITKTINAINTRENTKIAKITQEFNIPYNRLRDHLQDTSSTSIIRELHNKRLIINQEKAL